MWIISGVYLCKWTCVRAFGFWLHREGEMAEGTGEKGAILGKGVFGLEAHKALHETRAETWHRKVRRGHQPPLRSFIFSDKSPKLRECRRSRVGVTKRKVRTEEGKTWARLFRDGSWGCSPPSPPLWWQAHRVFALQGVHAPTLSPCASGGAKTSPQLPKGNTTRLRQSCLLHPRPPVQMWAPLQTNQSHGSSAGGFHLNFWRKRLSFQ